MKTETDIAYFAGLFDGEGSVGVYRVTNGQIAQPSGHRIYWGIRLSIVGIYRPIIVEAHEFWGGGFGKQKRQALQKTPGGVYDPKLCRQGWRWQLTSRHAIHSFLTDVFPYLREKKEQAGVAMKFCEGGIPGDEASALLKSAKLFEFNGVNVYAVGGNAGDHNPMSAKFQYPSNSL